MRKTISILLLLFTSIIWSQNYKFGTVSKAELEEKIYPLDSTANAAILYSERTSSFDFSYEKGFILIEEYFTRIKIYNTKGFDEATKMIKTFHIPTAEEDIRGIKGRTYNLEDGKIISTKLENKNVFREKINKYWELNKFTMPNIKKGSVIEWKYAKKSPFISMLDEVKLQEEIPIKKIVAKVYIPEYLVYNQKNKGYLDIPLQTSFEDKSIDYTYSYKSNEVGGFKTQRGKSTLNFRENRYIIEKNNIPAIIDEPYSGNINNYKSGVIFELAYTDYPNSSRKHYATNWTSVVEKIYKNPSFGDQIKKQNHFKEDMASLLLNTQTNEDKISKIVQFLKTKIKWNGYNGVYSEKGVKKAYKEGVGNSADINLNLIAMLQSIGLDANPVLISTIDNGIPMFPTSNGFNYVVAGVKLSERMVLLDATDEYSTPNILPSKTLNFRGRIVYPDGKSNWIDLFPKSHAIKKTTINAKFNRMGFEGNARTQNTNRYAYKYRKENKGKNKEDLISWIEENQDDIEVLDVRISNLDNLGKDVVETIKFETDSFYEEIGNKIYITPTLYLQIKENPFKSDKREFPVFYNTPWALVNVINITIPDDYSIESIPENTEFELPDNIGIYQSKIDKKDQVVKITTSFVINEPVITPKNYQNLKEFYKSIIENQTKKIILVANK